jgi:hypothetical protein
VAAGREIGIFLTWDECKQRVHRFSGAKHRCFSTRAAAECWLDASLRPIRPRRVRAAGRQRIRLVGPAAAAPLFLLMFIFTMISPANAFSIDPLVVAVAPYEAMEGIFPICYATLALSSGRSAIAFTLGYASFAAFIMIGIVAAACVMAGANALSAYLAYTCCPPRRRWATLRGWSNCHLALLLLRPTLQCGARLACTPVCSSYAQPLVLLLRTPSVLWRAPCYRLLSSSVLTPVWILPRYSSCCCVSFRPHFTSYARAPAERTRRREIHCEAPQADSDYRVCPFHTQAVLRQASTHGQVAPRSDEPA